MKRQERVLAQHHDLDYAVDRLTLLINAKDDILNERRSRYIVEREYRKLSKAIIAHFDYEESDGYMSEILLNAPQFASQVDLLVKDHATLRGMLQELDTLSYEDGPLTEFQEKICAALEAVRVHEQKENTLLQSYLVEELGRDNC